MAAVNVRASSRIVPKGWGILTKPGRSGESQMSAMRAQYFLAVVFLLLSLPIADPLRAEEVSAVLSGTVTGPSRALVAHAKVTVKNLATGQTSATQTNLLGFYTIFGLAPGDCEVSVSAEGFSAKTAKVTIAAGAQQTLDLTLVAASNSTQELSLGDLGISPNQAKGNSQEQAMLDKRSHMLQVHQRSV